MSYQPNTDTTDATENPTGPTTSDPIHVTDVDDLSRDDLAAVLDLAAEYKTAQQRGWTHADLSGQTLGMLFEKPSTRTRVSFETGMTQLGGHAVFLGEDDIQLGNGEPIRDTARALSRYVDVIMARLFDHADLEELARYSDVSVINGLTDDAHPCQTLADLLTIREAVGPFEDVSVTWVGDGNNVAQSFALGCALAGIDCTIATPAGYGVDHAVVDRADEIGTPPTVTTDPEAAVEDADVVYTDVWVSMGQEAQREERLGAFEPYQVNDELLAAAPDDASVMHCLPAHRGEEITDEVLESDRALVWHQAENRLHAQKGLLGWLQP
ncbi:ornithine carbamoyltransferase [Halovivax cerinus]|uniref:Ornithine carbamoyltransferase n=1 Tax=Halovivax cerinus TaxID=1487865 RepID=A0ABD5NK68_9EURY|nr:ornithine carbamoyltransferase [Halovivax cerinus]